MTRYTYLACDWATRTPILELPLGSVKFNTELNRPGKLDAEVSLNRQAADILDATDPCRTTIFVDRDGALVWGGFIWTRGWNMRSRKLKISAGDYWSYFWRRILRASTTYTATEQLTIADNLVNYAQGIANGNVGVTIPAVTASGVVRDRVYLREETKIIGELLQQLCEVNNGFDMSFDAIYSGSPARPNVQFNKFYPARGVSSGSTPLVFEYPGNIIDYDWPEDGASKSNYTMEIGGTVGSANLFSSATDATDTPAYPVLDQAFNRNDVIDQATLDGYANEDNRTAKKTIIVPKFTVRGDAQPTFGSYGVGDWFKASITDTRFPRKTNGDPGIEKLFRIVGIEVEPASSGSAEAINLSCDGAM